MPSVARGLAWTSSDPSAGAAQDGAQAKPQDRAPDTSDQLRPQSLGVPIASDAVGGACGLVEPENPSSGGHGQEELPAEGNFWRSVINWIVAIALCITLCALFFIFMEDFTDILKNIGKRMDGVKHHIGVVLGCTIASVLFTALPVPGKSAWIFVIGFVYKWWGFLYLYPGHVLGCLLGFVCARWIWRYRRCGCCEDGGGNCLPMCMHAGQPNKMLLLINASLSAIEERPLFIVTLLAFSHLPYSMLAYVLGAKANLVSWWQFMIPVSVAGLKVVVPIYFATKADDIAKLLKGDIQDDPVNLAVTIVSVVVAVASTLVVGRLSLRMLEEAQETGKVAPRAEMEAG